MGRRKQIRAILQLMSVPGSLVGLVGLLAVVGGVETGNLEIGEGIIYALVIVGMVYAVLWAAFGGEHE